mgnify:CR=1 FL=1
MCSMDSGKEVQEEDYMKQTVNQTWKTSIKDNKSEKRIIWNIDQR